MKTIDKKTTRAFGEKIYLLGVDKKGINHWIAAPKWDCSWYWGFGYIQTYTNNKQPDKASDILSHSHWNGLVGKIKGEYRHHLNENPDFAETTLSEKESWELADLMSSYYTFKEVAGISHIGHSGLTNTKINFKDKRLENKINQKILPKIFKRVDEILTPR